MEKCWKSRWGKSCEKNSMLVQKKLYVICRYKKVPPRESLKKVWKKFKSEKVEERVWKIFNNLGKRLKLKESLEKNVGKIGEKKLKKNSMLVQNTYVGTIKSHLERGWKKFKKEKVEERVWKKLKTTWAKS